MADIENDVISAAKEGHNLMILGQAGTGKTHLVKELSKILKADGKHVQLTASTGIAANLLHGMTVHKFCGILDGRFTDTVIVNRLLNDVDYEDIKHRLISTDILFIDEISMISSKVFKLIESVVRQIREAVSSSSSHQSSMPFGGMQVIIAGDFLQLRPVPNALYKDPGELILEMDDLTSYIPHKFILRDVKRQDQVDLIQAVQELSRGDISEQTQQLLMRMGRPLPPGAEPTRLFGQNYEVEKCNSQHLLEMEGDCTEYVSEDSGEARQLTMTSGLKKLYLKVGAPVILTVNLDDKLVNGSRGVVTTLNSNSVGVKFPNTSQEVIIKRYSFTVYSPTLLRIIAGRRQIPLRLAFALTVHRAQGLSLDRVEIDCTNINMPGHVGVAVGRCTSKKGLRVLNFTASRCLAPQPDYVNAFYDSAFVLVQNNKSCCTMSVIKSEITSNIPVTANIPHESPPRSPSPSDSETLSATSDAMYEVEMLEEFEDGDDDMLIDFLDRHAPNTDMPNVEWEIDEFVEKNYVEDPTTRQLTELNEILNKMRAAAQHVKLVSEKLINELSRLLPETYTATSQSTFYGKVTQFMSRDSYFIILKEMFATDVLTPCHYRAGFALVTFLRKKLIDVKAEPFNKIAKEIAEKRGAEYKSTPVGQANIRYIGGWCIATLKYAKIRRLGDSLYKPHKVDAANKLDASVKLLDGITLKDCAQSSDQASLSEIKRRQNLRGSLCTVGDAAFAFFKLLDKKVQEKESLENLNVHGEVLYAHINSELAKSEILCASWKNLFPNENVDADIVASLYKEVVEKYVFMSSSQFRKNIRRHFVTQKQEAHRKDILMRKKGKDGNAKEWSLAMAQKDQTAAKIATHRRLQSEAENNASFFVQFKKTELQLLCKAYGIKASSKWKKTVYSEKLILTIKKSMHMPHPGVFNMDTVDPLSVPEPVASTSSQVQSVNISSPLPASATSEPPSVSRPKRSKRTKAPSPVSSPNESLQDISPQPATSTSPEPASSSRPKRVRRQKAPSPQPSTSQVESPEDTSPKLAFQTSGDPSNNSQPTEPTKKVTKTKGSKKKRVKWPCGICGKESDDESIQCDDCDTWYHFVCVDITDPDTVEEIDWFCQKCLKK